MARGGEFRAWRWSGDNRYFQAAAIDFVAFGSGGHFGLWLGSSLTTGSTGRCATYENEPLTQHSVHGGLEEPHMGDSAFEVAEVQVWGFVEERFNPHHTTVQIAQLSNPTSELGAIAFGHGRS